MTEFLSGAALVFGSTGGIGRVVAREFARAGSEVAITWHSKPDVAADVAAEIEELGKKASHWQCDVADPATIRAAVDGAVATHGRIHTVVWGAGPLVEQLYLAETTAEQFRRAMDVEVHGFFNAVQAVLPHMRAAGGGSIVHLGSAGDLRWPDKDGLSVVPKAANEALIKGLAREEGRHGIRANTVLVGVIEAGMFLELSKRGVFDDAWVREVHKNLAIKRFGQPEEIAHAAIYLASTKAAYVTGQQIAVAGGYGI